MAVEIRKTDKRNMEKKNADKKNADKKNKTRCPVSKKCGGCQYIDMPYQEQLAGKQKYVEQLVKEFGKVQRIVGMEQIGRASCRERV